MAGDRITSMTLRAKFERGLVLHKLLGDQRAVRNLEWVLSFNDDILHTYYHNVTKYCLKPYNWPLPEGYEYLPSRPHGHDEG